MSGDAPVCGAGHGPMTRRQPGGSREQDWCGVWFDCAAPHCRNSHLTPSAELTAELERQRRAAPT